MEDSLSVFVFYMMLHGFVDNKCVYNDIGVHTVEMATMGQSRRPEKREREEDTVCSSVTEWLATPGPLSCVQPTRRAYSVSTRFGPIGHPIHPLKALLHRTYRVQSERETDRDGERILSCRRAQLVRLLLRTADWNERGGYEPIGRKVCHRSASLPYPRSCCLYFLEIFRFLSFLIFLNFFQLFLFLAPSRLYSRRLSGRYCQHTLWPVPATGPAE